MKRFIVAASTLLFLGAGCISFSGGNSVTSGPGGVFVSTNKGEKWTAISSVPTVNGTKNFANASVYGLIQDPNDSKALYWMTRGQGMLYSYDDGKSWKQAVSPMDKGFVYGVAIHPKDNCTVYATNGRQILKSLDCNRSWEESYREGRPDVTVRSIAFDPFNNHFIYALTSKGDLLRSEDGGSSWKPIKRFKAKGAKVVFDANREGLIYVTTRKRGLYRSIDGGETWESLKENMKEFARATNYRTFHVYPTEANHIYWISEHGIMFSKNAGEDWDVFELITPPGGAAIYGFAINPKNEKEMYYTATIQGKSTFYRTEDRGKNWVTKRLPSGQVPTSVRIHPKETNWIYLGFTIPVT